MSQKTIGIIIGLILIAGGGYIVWQGSQSQGTPATQTTGTDTSTGTTGTDASGGSGIQGGVNVGVGATTYTMAQVSTHNSASSCWSVIDGSVYDLTNWINQHPGGPQAILSLCGVDGSTAFHNQHDHAAKQENILATFKIGTLAQ